METIASFSAVKRLLDSHGLTAKKNLGQNFLIDGHVLSKIVKSADLSEDDLVIEVGPGLGGLTQELCKAAKKVYAIEIDKELIPVLQENLAEYDNLSLIQGDILKISLPEIYGNEKSVKLVANLPYYITTPIIMGVLENGLKIKSIIVMVQKEVGERMRAKPSTKEYGSLTLSVNYFADVSLVANVPTNCFFPRPGVDSCVIKLDILQKPRVEVDDEAFFFKLIKTAFSMRRKTLVNCISSSKELNFEKQEVLSALVKMGVSESIRGEALDIFQFSELTKLLHK